MFTGCFLTILRHLFTLLFGGLAFLPFLDFFGLFGAYRTVGMFIFPLQFCIRIELQRLLEYRMNIPCHRIGSVGVLIRNPWHLQHHLRLKSSISRDIRNAIDQSRQSDSGLVLDVEFRIRCTAYHGSGRW